MIIYTLNVLSNVLLVATILLIFYALLYPHRILCTEMLYRLIEFMKEKKKRFKKKRIKNLLHKVIPFILVGVITSSAVMMSYEKVREVKAEPVTTTILVGSLLAVMASMGVVYATPKILEMWQDGNNALDPDYEDIYNDWENGYESEWQVLYGNGSSGDNNPGDNGNDEKPPHFKELLESISLSGSTAIMTAKAFDLLVTSGKTMIQKTYELGTLFAEATIPDGANIDINYIDKNTTAIIFGNHPYLVNGVRGYNVIIQSDGPICFVGCQLFYDVNSTQNIIVFSESGEKTGTLEGFDWFNGGKHNDNGVYSVGISRYVSHLSKYPTFSTKQEAIDYIKQSTGQNDNHEPIWVTPELQDTYENTGQFEFPENMPSPLRVPGSDDLAKLARRLNPEENPDYNPEVIPEYIKQYIDELRVNPNPDPDPNPNPNPNPDPDPDNPGDNTGDDTPKNESFLADLKHLFPFCIPFDLVDCFRLFNAEPVTPRVEVPVHFGIINYDHTFVFDLSDFNGVAVVCRSMFLILYMVGLILATRALIKG